MEDVISKCGEITKDLGVAMQGSHNAMIDLSDADHLIEEAEMRLIDAQTFIEVQGQNALREAREAQDRFGQQSERMTEIARQARVEAERSVAQVVWQDEEVG